MKIIKRFLNWYLTHEKVRVAVLHTIMAVSLGCSIAALSIANSDVRGDCEMEYNQYKATELAGLIFTVIGAVFALYFVILGIDASKKRDEMKRYVEDLKKELLGLEKERTNNLDTVYSHMIQIVDTIKGDKTRKRITKSLQKSRARLAIQPNLLPLETRKQKISELIKLGDQSDVEALKKLLKDSKEEEEIKDYAIGIILLIETRLKEENQSKD